MSPSNESTAVSHAAGGYSAKVRLYLIIAGEHIPLAQVGDTRLYFDTPTLLPPGPAEVVVEIDGEPRSSPVMIPELSEPSRIIECTNL